MQGRKTGLSLVLLFLVGCQSLEQQMVYHPVRCDRTSASLPPDVQDVILTTRDGVKIHARWLPHPQSKGAVLYCHGNGGNVDLWESVARELSAALGQSVLLFDYPGYGQSEGHPEESGCYTAAEAAYHWLISEQKIPAGRIIVYGQSLGGAVAVELASRQPHRALVLVRTFASLPAVASAHWPLLSPSLLMRNRFPSEDKIGRCTRPIFIAQADRDRLIPFEHGQRLRQAAGASCVHFHVLLGLGHNDPLDTDFYAALRRFLQQCEEGAPLTLAPPSHNWMEDLSPQDAIPLPPRIHRGQSERH